MSGTPERLSGPSVPPEKVFPPAVAPAVPSGLPAEPQNPYLDASKRTQGGRMISPNLASDIDGVPDNATPGFGQQRNVENAEMPAISAKPSSEAAKAVDDVTSRRVYLPYMSDTEPVDLQQEIVERGDRLLPDEPNKGFDIIRLPQEQKPGTPVPLESALPISYTDGGPITKIANELAANDLVDRLMDGTSDLRPVVDVNQTGQLNEKGLKIDYPVKDLTYDAAVMGDIVEARLFDSEGTATGMDPRTKALDTLVDPAQKRAILEAAVRKEASGTRLRYINDLFELQNYGYTSNLNLSEAYDVSDAGRTMRILNCSSRLLSDEQLRQAANVIRSYSDKTGGALFDSFRTIIIVPEDNRTLLIEDVDDQGKIEVPYSMWQRGASLIISERVIQRPEDRKPLPERVIKYWEKCYDQYRLEGEPREGPGSPKPSAAMQEWEPLLAHEFEHNVLPDNDVKLPGPGPTLYSRPSEKRNAWATKREHTAELAAIEYMGGEDALAVPVEQSNAKAEMWYQERGSNDNKTEYKQPLGPRFVICRELDITRPLPPRLREPYRAVPAEITYHLESATPDTHS